MGDPADLPADGPQLTEGDGAGRFRGTHFVQEWAIAVADSGAVVFSIGIEAANHRVYGALGSHFFEVFLLPFRQGF